jgi:hypothetical protein
MLRQNGRVGNGLLTIIGNHRLGAIITICDKGALCQGLAAN